MWQGQQVIVMDIALNVAVQMRLIFTTVSVYNAGARAMWSSTAAVRPMDPHLHLLLRSISCVHCSGEFGGECRLRLSIRLDVEVNEQDEEDERVESDPVSEHERIVAVRIEEKLRCVDGHQQKLSLRININHYHRHVSVKRQQYITTSPTITQSEWWFFLRRHQAWHPCTLST